LFAQNQEQANKERFLRIENQLKALSVDMPGLDEQIELSVSNINIQEFIRAIANTNKINVYIDPSLDMRITNNFSNVTVSAVLLFLCKQYDLDINFIGNILSISKYTPVVVETPVVAPPPKPLNIKFNIENQTVSMDLSGDSLQKVTKEITRQSGKNIVFPAEIAATPISFYVENVPLDDAIEKMAMSNGLLSDITKDGFYMLEKPLPATQQASGNNSSSSGRRTTSNRNSNDYEYSIENNLISLRAQNVAISDIINDVSKELQVNYMLFSEVKGNITSQLTNVTYDQLLEKLLNGTTYTTSKQGEIYMIGERQQEGLRQVKVVQLQHRSVENLSEHIPKEIQKDVTVKEFPELNSIVISGSRLMINEIETFLHSVDKVVPVILIDVIIVSSKKHHTVNTGLNLGFGNGDAPAKSSLKFSNTGIQTTLSSSTLNNIISSLSGSGSVNMGRVTPDFYMSLNLLEAQGVIRVHSTPQLATLNSHEASLTIGETEYYKEIQNTVIGTQNPQNIQAYQYKSISANLSISIKPMFSGDDQVTLDIKVEQSGFKKNRVPDAPPGSETKSFNSMIRVKNEEMVLLGGLEEISNSNTGSGLPLLSRIPILKWFFSSREKEKSNSKLNIFIKPTVLF
jgi:type IV pilus assembly protein PilQ